MSELTRVPRIARDIAWAVQSPPLLLPEEDRRFPKQDWFNTEYAAIEGAIAALRQDPEEIERITRLSTQLRLGGYFERLILWWLKHSPNYDVLAHDLQVHLDGLTQGAFDLIVRDTRDGVIEHWELACKFYLQDGLSAELDSWFGPARKDKLILKYQHLRQHQIALSESEAGREALKKHGWQVKRQRIIVKGRLFGEFSGLPPEVNSDCLKGWMNTASQHSIQAPEIPLQRQHWMSEIIHGDIAAPNAETAHRHNCLCVARLENEVEVSRGFVVPDNWAQNRR